MTEKKQPELPSILYVAFEDGMHLAVHTSPTPPRELVDSREKHFNALGKFHVYSIATYVRMPSPADHPRVEHAPIEERVKATLLALGYVTQEELVKRILESEANVDEMHHTFDMQWRAAARARAMWQEQTGRHDTWPDTGNLMHWLMQRVDAIRVLAELRRNNSPAEAHAMNEILEVIRTKEQKSGNDSNQG